jgi:pterin-4a-carbinolamine dehydratase
MTPTPHGVGPLCAALLCYNTLALAEARQKAKEALDIKPTRTTSWERKMCSKTNSPFLAKIVRCRDFSSAVRFIQEVEAVAQRLDHHPTLHVNSRRVCEREEGCDVAVELNTYSTRSITEEDFILADAIDKIAASM